MSLPWFPFNIKDFIANTMRLNTEAKGAYLLLLLDYYEHEKAPPDDDAVLATIAGLSLDAWKVHRRVLEPLFNVLDGCWKHIRAEEEIAAAKLKHANTVARATAGGRAKAAKRQNPASSTPQAMPAECLPGAQTQTHIDSLSSRARAPDSGLEGKGPEPNGLGAAFRDLHDAGIIDAGTSDPEDAPPDERPGLGTPINPDYQPPRDMLENMGAQADASTITLEIQKFVYHHADKGSFSHDWDAAFAMWWERFIAHHAKQAKKRPPRVEVNSDPAQLDYRKAVERFSRNQSLWNRRVYGPEPGMPGCRAPPELLIEFGLIAEPEKANG